MFFAVKTAATAAAAAAGAQAAIICLCVKDDETHQRGLQVHAEVLPGPGVQLLLELGVLRVVRRTVRDDEHGLNGGGKMKSCETHGEKAANKRSIVSGSTSGLAVRET